ncbi:MAG: metallophosphoesterase family protein [Rhodocyclaceae bacterium]|nr:metallophosphoesterase family protein [Rhodocyclaceae bacterium]
MKICIVSDSHDRGPLLAAAVEAAKNEGAEAVIHCGDLIGVNTVKAALKLGLPIHMIHGNNLGDLVALARLACHSEGLLHYHGRDADITLGEKRVFVTHYPHYGRAMACTGDYDLVCCGHSHKPEIRQQANIKGDRSWLVNPGTVAGLGAPESTWIMGELGDLDGLVLPSFEIRYLLRD